eukprot:m.144303 g.144303  ORF g.144303 m.144303 type:complete len:122 (-) comp17709_c0_seq4:3595-3960(-)
MSNRVDIMESSGTVQGAPTTSKSGAASVPAASSVSGKLWIDVDTTAAKGPSSWLGNYCRFLVLDVVHEEYQTAECGRPLPQLVLRMIDERTNMLKTCTLRGDWIRTTVRPGDFVHVSHGQV